MAAKSKTHNIYLCSVRSLVGIDLTTFRVTDQFVLVTLMWKSKVKGVACIDETKV